VLLPRSNPAALFNLGITPLIAEVGKTDDPKEADRVSVEITWEDSLGNKNRRGMSLVKEEVDDLIVMLTYYRREVFGEA